MLMALVCVLFLFQIMLIQGKVREELYDTAEQMALMSYAQENLDALGDIRLGNYGLGGVVGTANVNAAVSDAQFSGYIVGAVVCTENTDDEDMVDITANYVIKLPISFFGNLSFPMTDHARVRKWTGYDPAEGADTGDREEEMVYITPTGVAYHRDRGCSYLNPSISGVSYQSLSYRRNTGGGIYYPCATCARNCTGGTVYITNYGGSYHTDLNCSGLKRTIYCVPLSEVGGRHPCSRCGG